MTGVLDILPNAYRSAGRRVAGDVGAQLRMTAALLEVALEDTGGMAGSDDCGREWGTSYDNAASSTLSAMTDLHNGLQVVGELLDQTAANYASAESASAGAVIVGREFYAEVTGSLASAPSSVGAGVVTPNGWGLVEAFVHRAWPNGHQDQLHKAGQAWQRLCNQLLDFTSEIDQGAIVLMEQRAPEVANAVIVVNDLRSQMITLANQCWAIGVACHGYAHHLDEAHHRIIALLEQLAHDTAETVVVGTLFAIVTAGAGAVAAGIAEAAAVRSAAAAIAAVIDVLLAASVSVAAEADLAATRVAEVTNAMRPVLAREVEQARLVQSTVRIDGVLIARAPAADSAVYSVTSTTVPAKALARLAADAAALNERIAAGAKAPKLVVTAGQLRKKFKHAPIFGINGTPTTAELERFAGALEDFVVAPSTTTVLGSYRHAQRYLSYDRLSGLVVVRKLDGEFVSAWTMGPKQATNVYWKGDLGGG